MRPASSSGISQSSMLAAVEGATIVLAEDDRLSRDHTAGLLRARGFVVETVEDGQLAIERVAQGGVDLVLLDVVMPRMNGLETCRLLKGMPHDTFLPVMLLTVKSDTASRVEGLKIGADDYVCKPVVEQEFLARVDAMLRIKKLTDHVNSVRTRLEQLSVHDELTGLYNYRYLNSRLTEEFKRAERYHEPLACMIVDVDGMAGINGAHGRETGDRLLVEVADCVRRSVREIDVVARFGGDEFLVALPSTHFAGSVAAAERLAHELSLVKAGDPVPRPTVSIGVALFPSRDVASKDALLRSADVALRRAKADGGNAIYVYQEEGHLYSPTPTEAQPGAGAAGDPTRGQK